MIKEKTISERLRDYLDKHDMKPGAFADLTGLPKQNVYKWARGTKPSDARDYKKLEDFLNGKIENVPRETEKKNIKKSGEEPDFKTKYYNLLEVFKEVLKGNVSSDVAAGIISKDHASPGHQSEPDADDSKKDIKRVYKEPKKS